MFAVRLKKEYSLAVLNLFIVLYLFILNGLALCSFILLHKQTNKNVIHMVRVCVSDLGMVVCQYNIKRMCEYISLKERAATLGFQRPLCT